MAGTKIGAKKSMEKLKLKDTEYLEKYGMTWRQYIGRIGGKASVGGGFKTEKIGKDGLNGQQRARKVGRIGGLKSRRKQV